MTLDYAGVSNTFKRRQMLYRHHIMGGIYSAEKPNKQIPLQTRIPAVVQKPNKQIPLQTHVPAVVQSPNIPPVSPPPNLPSSNNEEVMERRQFGHFQCTYCHKKWQSSHAWKGKQQKCTRCSTYVLPTNLQNIQPTYEYTYRCMNTKCKNTLIVCDRIDSKDLNNALETRQEFVCNQHKNKQVYKYKSKPSEINIHYHPVYEVQLCAYCKSCRQKNKMTITDQVDKMILQGFKRQCQLCNQIASQIIKIKKLESDPSKPHKRELCEKCQEIGGYCGK